MSVWKQCKCRVDVLDEDGNPVRDDKGKKVRRELGHKCPDLRQGNGSYNPNHGVWYARFEAEPETEVIDGRAVLDAKGRPKTKRRTVKKGGFTTKRDAQKWIDEQKAKAKDGFDVTGRLTVAEWLTEWLKIKAASNVKQSTMVSYTQHVEKFWIPKIGHRDLRSLRDSHILAALAELDSSDATKQRYRATLRAALNAAKKRRHIAVNVAEEVEIKNGDRPEGLEWTGSREVEFWADYETRLAAARKRAPNASAFKIWRETKARPSPVMVWTKEQVKRFVDYDEGYARGHAAGHPLYALYYLISLLGLRRGEAIGIRRQDLDLGNKVLTVQWTLTNPGGKITEGPTKNGRSRRIPLWADIVQVLRDHIGRQAEQRAKIGSGWVETPYVFTREDGSMLNPEQVSDTFEQLAFEAGLPPIRLHDLRHTAASLMYAAKVPPKVIQMVLGHATQAITMDIYTALFEDASRDIMEAFGESMRSPQDAPEETSGPPSVPHPAISGTQND